MEQDRAGGRADDNDDEQVSDLVAFPITKSTRHTLLAQVHLNHMFWKGYMSR